MAAKDLEKEARIYQTILYPVPTLSTNEHAVLTSSKKSTTSPQDSTASASKPITPHSSVVLPSDDKNRWSLISQSLLPENIKNIQDIVNAIGKYNGHVPDHKTLQMYVGKLEEAERNNFFNKIIPNMIKLALGLPVLFEDRIPRLVAQRQMSITMSQQQAACLLACAFFCLFESDDDVGKKTPKRPSTIHFYGIFKGAKSDKGQLSKIEKLVCFMNYFKRVTTKMPDGLITFHRRVLTKSNFPEWSKCSAKLKDVVVREIGLIEDGGKFMSQIDFANKAIGGGVLGDGCVQEEIRFTVCPELIVACLLSDVMGDNECIVVIGCEQFCKYTGYGFNFAFKSDYVDQTSRDEFGRRITEVVAMDALHFYSVPDQFQRGKILRELNKAYCGFFRGEFMEGSQCSYAIASGNWGCGAFNGDHHLKALIQLMASAANKRDLYYFTFNFQKLKDDIIRFYKFAVTQEITVASLWKHAVDYAEIRKAKSSAKDEEIHEDIFSFIMRQTPPSG